MAELVEDFCGVIKVYSDGSVIRGDESSVFPLSPEQPNNYNHVEYKDVVLNGEINGLWVRIYLPPETNRKLPVILYYHGGGFVICSPATALMHRQCQMWTATMGAVIISVNYRLAPEHRLPAAYHDSIAALEWLHSQAAAAAAAAAEGADPWLRSYADFSRVFLAGESAGGNIAHHVGVWGEGKKREMEIKGVILLYPYFGCEERTASEKVENSKSGGLSLEMSDTMWRLALPVGSNRDHPFCNPLVEEARVISSTRDLPPLLFVIAGHDVLRDQQLRYCDLLRECGKEVRVHLCHEEDHGFMALKLEEPCSIEAIRIICQFIK